jgi:hypothetical protein
MGEAVSPAKKKKTGLPHHPLNFNNKIKLERM